MPDVQPIIRNAEIASTAERDKAPSGFGRRIGWGRKAMRKRYELTDPKSCMVRARDDEMTFVLLGRDAAAPVAIRAWIEERIRLGKNQPNDEQIIEAGECAQMMEEERDQQLWKATHELTRTVYEERSRAVGFKREVDRLRALLFTYITEGRFADGDPARHYMVMMPDGTPRFVGTREEAEGVLGLPNYSREDR